MHIFKRREFTLFKILQFSMSVKVTNPLLEKEICVADLKILHLGGAKDIRLDFISVLGFRDDSLILIV